MTVDMTEVRQLFFEESLENLDVMESGLLDLDIGTVNKELINSIFRAAHSIKGGAGIFKFEELINFAHTAEALLTEMRDGQHVITQSVINTLLQAVDIMRMMLSSLKEGNSYEKQRLLVCQDELNSLLKTPLNKPFLEEETPTVKLEMTAPQGWHIVFKPHLTMLTTGNDPINLFRELATLGDLVVQVNTDQLPTFEALNPYECHLSWELTLHTEAARSLVQEIFEWVEDDCELEITSLDEKQQPEDTSLTTVVAQEVSHTNGVAENSILPTVEPPTVVESLEVPLITDAVPPIPSVTPTTGGKSALREPSFTGDNGSHNNSLLGHAAEASSIRVSIDKIDELINIVGELVITQSMLDQVGESFEPSKLEQLRDGLAQLERNTRELQESVMRIRMLPISYSFNRFPRLVHDLSIQLGKKVELKLTGENTELDKTVLEKMSDPLVHLVRNALDHGIEFPEQRRTLGKPEVGLLHLHAFHQGGNIVIQISDDGAGFDMEKIRKKAIQKGFFTTDENVSIEQLYELVFQPGFSTATQVSDLSGRGVGMDVVRRNIRSLGGTIDIQSKFGEGATFNIRLPLTLAILDGQLIRIGKQIYILPLLSILESLRINPRYVSVLAGKAEVYKLRNEYIPILRLYVLFNVNSEIAQLDQGLLVIVEGDGHKIGLFVDELLSQQQIVIKSLDSNYKQIAGISGATILGDGSVALILDVAGLIRLFHTQSRSQPYSSSIGVIHE